MITFLAFIFVLSLLVFVHELGHFTIAKLSGIGVERFSIGLPPRLFSVTLGETEYCISMIPFGGYVKLTGQDDFEYEKEDDEIGPGDYRGKSTPVKIAVLAAGSLMNLLTAAVIFSLLFWTEGVPEKTNRIGYVTGGTVAEELGFKPGDEIVAVNGENIEAYEQALLPLYTEDKVTLNVKDLSGIRTITVPRRLDQREDFGILPYYPAKVGRTIDGSPAEKAGFQAGDLITAIDDVSLDGGWIHMTEVIEANPDRELVFTVVRNESEITIPAIVGHETVKTPDGNDKIVGKVGLAVSIEATRVGGLTSIGMAFERTAFISLSTVDFFVKLVTGRMSPKLLGGPVLIAQIAGESAKSGLSTLMGFTAFISINLGVLNLLPFPVLDGGHITILFIETVIRRKFSYRVRMAIQQAGSIILILFMIYITFNDLLRFDKIAQLFGG